MTIQERPVGHQKGETVYLIHWVPGRWWLVFKGEHGYRPIREVRRKRAEMALRSRH